MRLFRVFAGALALAFLAFPSLAADRAIIILDGSGSMWAQIEGEARISIARETLSEVLDSIPDGLELGFMSYGHRERGNCGDIELMVEPASGTAGAIRDAAAAINPLGKTPITEAVRRAAEDLRYTEDKATVILITDGIESCEADPCALASELESNGIDFTTHVLGFGLSDEEGAQVACLAENTGGRYFQAGDGDSLAEALTTTVAEVTIAPEPEPEPTAEPEPEPALAHNLDPEAVMAADGAPFPEGASISWTLYKVNADGSRGDWILTGYTLNWQEMVEPGDYILRAEIDRVAVEQPVTVAADAVAEPLFVMDAGRLILRPLPSEGAEVDANAATQLAVPGGESRNHYGLVNVYVPAGDSIATVEIGEGEAIETISVAAGETVERDIIVGVGLVQAGAAYVDGMMVEDGGLFIEVFGARKALDGSRESFGYHYGPGGQFELPPGDYVLIATMGAASAEVPVSVASGELSEAVVVLGAGVLAVEAPGTDYVEIFGAKPDIQGNRKSFGYAYGGALQTTLPAGDYVIEAHAPDNSATKEATATVVAGERTDVTVE